MTIDEVLRLLTRSKQQGSLDVTGSGLRGRVFIGTGGVDLATIWAEDELHDHLVNSGLVDEDDLRRVTTEVTTLAAIADSNQDIVELIREMTVESLYQIGQNGEDFIVREGASTPYASPKSFELEHLIQDAEARERDWANVSELVPDLNSPIRFRRDLGERDEVAVKVDDWRVLSEIGAGASVSQIANKLGTTEFWTAKITSRLVQKDLVDILEQEAPPEVDDPWQGGDDTQDVYQEPTAEISEPAADPADFSYSPSGVAPSPPDDVAGASDDEDVNPNESWWQEPEAEDAEETPDSAEGGSEAPEVVGEGLSEMPTTQEDGAGVEEDTEAFLEKVFSELESSEQEEADSEDEAEEGHGLLRRRRMGSLRDFSSDS